MPETVWIEIRERLKSTTARGLFVDAIAGYCQNLRDEIENYVLEYGTSAVTAESANLRQKIQGDIFLLRGVVRFGLGLSSEAVQLPLNVDTALRDWEEKGPLAAFYNRAELEKEISLSVEDTLVITDIQNVLEDSGLLIAAIDGSTRSGLSSLDVEQGDFTVGSYPVVSINTSVGCVNRMIKAGGSSSPAFARLPEKPEDMQQSENRHTIMAKLFYPDITDGEYIHSVWNAMDVLEARMTLRVMRRWYTSKAGVEIRPADLVLRDGTVAPQERDFTHYVQQDSYGKITRDLIEISWEIVKKCRDDGQTVVGIVKRANLKVLAPIINWFVCQLLASSSRTQIQTWPLQAMNQVTDQLLLSRLLTAGRRKNEPWYRTCVILRPFHSVTKFAHRYTKAHGRTPAEQILRRASQSASDADGEFERDDSWLRSSDFRKGNDSYIQLLKNCWYASTYVASVPRLDLDNVLPRCEFILPVETIEANKFPMEQVSTHLLRLLTALRTLKFDVSADHSMFQQNLKIDVLPSLLIRVRETVKIWAAELVARVNETIGYYISKRVGAGTRRGVKVRPWTARELKEFAHQLETERNLQAGLKNLDDGSPALSAE